MPKIEIELPEIEGYEYTGEYRVPEMNEYYLFINGKEHLAGQYTGGVGPNIIRHHILRPIKKRWKPKQGGKAFMINLVLEVCPDVFHIDSESDRELLKIGNYFRTKEQAEEAAKRIKATLDAFHDEIGE